MKKFIIIALAFICSTSLCAQVDINEFDLVGEWYLDSSSGDFNYHPLYDPSFVACPDSLIFYSEDKIVREVGKVLIKDDSQSSGFRTRPFIDFFITYGKTLILHLRTSESSGVNFRFRIMGYSGEDLLLNTFDGKGSLKYKRKTAPAAVVPKVKADDKSRLYGDENPQFTYTVTEGTLAGTPELTTSANF